MRNSWNEIKSELFKFELKRELHVHEKNNLTSIDLNPILLMDNFKW